MCARFRLRQSQPTMARVDRKHSPWLAIRCHAAALMPTRRSDSTELRGSERPRWARVATSPAKV